MTITPETIAELRGLMEITSPLPWEWTEDLTALLSGYEGETRVVDTAMAFRAYYQLRVATSDATLIAAAVNALPALLDAAERLARVQAALDSHPDPTRYQYASKGPISCGWKSALIDVHPAT